MIKNICYESTKQCNMRCEYCLTSDNIGLENVLYRDIVNFIKNTSPERIVISGGEPLLDFNLVDKLILLKRKDNHISISTNGSIDYNFEQLSDYVDCIDFSLPALNPLIFKKLRGFDFVSKVKNNIESAVALGLSVRISFVLTSMNKDELTDILEYAGITGVNSVRIGKYFPFRNAYKFRDKYEVDDEYISKVLDRIDLNKYPFRIIPPIKSLSAMTYGYIVVNFLGEVFLPDTYGKNILGDIYSFDFSKLNQILESQKEIFI